MVQTYQNEKKFCFIICVNCEYMAEECMLYISRLLVPKGYEVDILTIMDASSMTSGYNEGMAASDAKYKIYIHQDVYITDRYFLYEVLDIFQLDITIGMIGAVGTRRMKDSGVMWEGDRISSMYGKEVQNVEKCDQYQSFQVGDLVDVEAIDGMLMATQNDIEWREDIFDDFDFYDASQSMEFLKRGYRIVVPVMDKPMCVHDDGVILNLVNYDINRGIFLREYGMFLKKRHSKM